MGEEEFVMLGLIEEGDTKGGIVIRVHPNGCIYEVLG